MNIQKAIFAAGCFWGVQSVFDMVPGVLKTVVGYSGGKRENPTYEQVCTGATGHAESVEIEFDPTKVSYEKLLDVLFENHDPTTVDRQGWDRGNEYRSAIFYLNEEQKELAKKKIADLTAAKKYMDPIVTEVTAASPFYPAEEYHQKFLAKRGKFVCE